MDDESSQDEIFSQLREIAQLEKERKAAEASTLASAAAAAAFAATKSQQSLSQRPTGFYQISIAAPLDDSEGDPQPSHPVQLNPQIHEGTSQRMAEERRENTRPVELFQNPIDRMNPTPFASTPNIRHLPQENDDDGAAAAAAISVAFGLPSDPEVPKTVEPEIKLEEEFLAPLAFSGDYMVEGKLTVDLVDGINLDEELRREKDLELARRERDFVGREQAAALKSQTAETKALQRGMGRAQSEGGGVTGQRKASQAAQKKIQLQYGFEEVAPSQPQTPTQPSIVKNPEQRPVMAATSPTVEMATADDESEEEDDPKSWRKEKKRKTPTHEDQDSEDTPNKRKRTTDDALKSPLLATAPNDAAEPVNFMDDSDDDGPAGNLTQLTQPELVEEEAQHGIIESVVLVNFMCHKYFRMDFGPHVNFVTGPNGSGKSAVLTGITICLGGKASVTSCAMNVKNFIKTGETRAEVSVTIRNRGDEAFKHDLYGDRIIVERTMSETTPSSYKIYGASGKVVARSREELDALLDHFVIQVENPLVILSQDTAREFLVANDSRKYHFFMVGTLLESIRKDQVKAKEELDRSKAILKEKKKDMETMRTELQQMHTKIVGMNTMQSLEERIAKMKGELSWAKVKVKRGEVEDLEKAIEGVRVSQTPSEERARLVQQDLAKAGLAIQEAIDKKEQVAVTKSEKEAASKVVEEFLPGDRKKIGDFRTDLKDCGRKVLIGSLTQKMDMETLKLEANTTERRQEKRAAIVKQREWIQQLRERLTTEQTRQQNLQEKLDECEGRRDDQRRKSEDSKDLIASLRRLSTDLRQRKENHLVSYGHNVPRLLDLMREQSHMFRGKVIGPMGLYVKLKNPKWKDAVSAVIGNLLSFFVVQNWEDEKRLKALIRQSGCFNSIITRRSWDCPNSSFARPDKRYTTVLNLLEFTEPVVQALLIDIRNIEQTVVVRTIEEAEEIVYHRQERNVDCAFTAVGEKLYMKGTSRNFVNYRNNREEGSGAIFGDIDTEIRDARDRLSEAENDSAEAQSRERELEVQVQSLKKEIKQSQEASYRTQRDVERQKRELADQEEEYEQHTPGNLAALVQERNELAGALALLKSQFEEIKRQISQAQVKMEPRMRELAPIQQEILELGETEAELTSELDSSLAVKQRVEGDVLKREKVAAEGRRKIDVRVEELKSLQRELEEIEKKATAESPRVEPTKSVHQLEGDIKKLSKTLADQVSQFDTSNEVKVEYEAKKASLISISRNMKSIRESTERLTQMLVKQEERAIWMRKQLSLRTKMFFHAILQHRGFLGKLKLDHNKCKLQLLVQPHKGKDVKETNQLFGGERAFSTVAFLLAVWEAMECPFRILDGYDVFIDAAVRQLSTKAIIEFAQRQPEHQLILISPQDMTQIPVSNKLHVIRMEPPERN